MTTILSNPQKMTSEKGDKQLSMKMVEHEQEGYKEASLLLAGDVENITLGFICLNTERHQRTRFESEKQCLKILGLICC